jgi:folate-binding protein YgfZ
MRRLPLRDLHAAAGASFAEASGWEVVADYGDAAGELAAARRGATVADRSDLARLRVGGPDAVALLHRISTQDVRGLAPGRATRAGFTDAKGNVVAAFLLLRPREGPLEIVSDAGLEGTIRCWIERYAITEEVRLEGGAPAAFVLCGPRAAAVLGDAAGADLAALSPDGVAEGEAAGARLAAARIFPDPRAGFLVLVEEGEPRRAWEALVASGARPAGRAVLEALRIEAGIPAHGLELTAETNPLEAALEDAVSWTKGCFTGQETLARLRTYGGVRRRLVRLDLPGDPPAPGSPVRAAGREVGRVTSAAALPGEARSVALALVAADVPAGDLEVAGRPARPRR